MRKDAEAWARRVERNLDVGRGPLPRKLDGISTFGHLIDLHIRDMKSVGKAADRSKAYSMTLLREKLGRVRLIDLDRETLIGLA